MNTRPSRSPLILPALILIGMILITATLYLLMQAYPPPPPVLYKVTE